MSAPDPGVGAGLLERAQGCLLGQDGDIRLPPAAYFRPRCRDITMQFAPVGLWD